MHLMTAIMTMLFMASALASPSVQDEADHAELEVRRLINDGSEDRLQLHDDFYDDAATDGFASDVQENCRNFTVRYMRSDGKTVTRKVNRCD